MKAGVAAAVVATAFVMAACSMLGPSGEEFREQPKKTVYRSTDESAIDNPSVTPLPRKVPGE